MKTDVSVSFFAGATRNLLPPKDRCRRRTPPRAHDRRRGCRARRLLRRQALPGAADRAGDVPWTILRATQFHEFAALMFHAAKAGPLHAAPRGRMQPIAVREVAEHLVTLAEDGAGRPRQPNSRVRAKRASPRWSAPTRARSATGLDAGDLAPRRVSAARSATGRCCRGPARSSAARPSRSGSRPCRIAEARHPSSFHWRAGRVEPETGAMSIEQILDTVRSFDGTWCSPPTRAAAFPRSRGATTSSTTRPTARSRRTSSRSRRS